MNQQLRDREFYETPAAFTRWLFETVCVTGRCFEPCVGSGAILRDSFGIYPNGRHPVTDRTWLTNDIEPDFAANYHYDARSISPSLFGPDASAPDWTISNPPFTPALDIIAPALGYSRVGVAMHVRISFNEPLQHEPRRSFLREHRPSRILFLPRWAYQRSPKTGKWATDNMAACWLVWERHATTQQIGYAPETVFLQLDREEAAYRERMDFVFGYTGSESERQQQAKRSEP
jgi:hypothetical protein